MTRRYKRLYSESHARYVFGGLIVALSIAVFTVTLAVRAGADPELDTRAAILDERVETVVAPSTPAPVNTSAPIQPQAATAVMTATPIDVPSPTAMVEPSPEQATVSMSPTPDTSTPAPELDLTAFRAAVDAVVNGVEGTVAVSLAASDGTVLYELNAEEGMEAASLYKVPIMVELYRQREAGLLSFDDGVLLKWSYFSEGADSIGYGALDGFVTVDTLLFAMVAQSSNVAAYALLDLVGNDNVNATMEDLGLDGIQIRWSPRHLLPPPAEQYPDVVDEIEEFIEDGAEPIDEEIPPEEEPVDVEPSDNEGDPASGSDPARADWMSVTPARVALTVRADEAWNVVSAIDLARLFVMMLGGELVNESASAEMLDLLGRQQIPGGLGFQLPDGTVAHKTGYLEDGVVNDAGIIFGASGTWVAIVLTEDVREDIAYDLMSRIGLMMYQFEIE
jgi:beta-lactamase class A